MLKLIILRCLSISIKDPLDQFNIKIMLSVGGDLLAKLHIYLTNIGLYLILVTFIIIIVYTVATNYNITTPNS